MAVHSCDFYLCAVTAWIIQMQNASSTLQQTWAFGDFVIYFFFNFFSALTHAKCISPRAWFLKCLQSTSPSPTERLHNCPCCACLQPVVLYRTTGQCIYFEYLLSYETAWCVCCDVTSYVTIREPLFRQMSDSDPLLGSVCAGILPSTCVEFSCHSTLFFAVIH